MLFSSTKNTILTENLFKEKINHIIVGNVKRKRGTCEKASCGEAAATGNGATARVEEKRVESVAIGERREERARGVTRSRKRDYRGHSCML